MYHHFPTRRGWEIIKIKRKLRYHITFHDINAGTWYDIFDNLSITHVGCLGELGGDGFFAIVLPNKK